MFALVFCIFVALASAGSDDRHQLYGRSMAPHPFMKLDNMPDNAGVKFTIALKQKNLDVLEEVLMDVSDPFSPNYGRHWTHEKILDLVAPSLVERAPVFDWLKHVAGDRLIDIQDRGDAFRVSTSVGVAEDLFHTKLHMFVDTSIRQVTPHIKFIGQFSIPKHLERVISMVTGITEFPTNVIKTKVVEATGTTQCNVPYTMKMIYNMSDDIVIRSPSASQAPFSVDSHETKTIGFGENDLSSWEQINRLPEVPVSNIIGDAAALYGPTDSSLAGGEALLDVQMMLAFAPAANTSFWIIADWIYEYANEILNTHGSPFVNSMSYGWEETNQCDITDCNALGFPDSKTYIERTDAEFMKCGVAGFTVLAASGDNGVEPNRACTEMYQVYPASSLYVTTVGATAIVKSDDGVQLKNPPPICSDSRCTCSTSQLEHGAMHNNTALFDTGGGFSHYNARPHWQDAAVKQYLSSGLTFPANNYWNSNNRGYPDVAAAGGNIAVFQHGGVTQVAGTSASCPIWAAMLSVLNDDRIAAHKPTLGFANPLLYSMWEKDSTTFNDITVGSNGGNHYIGSGACNNLNFYATTGWDAVSGLGSPNFGRIRQFVAGLNN